MFENGEFVPNHVGAVDDITAEFGEVMETHVPEVLIQSPAEDEIEAVDPTQPLVKVLMVPLGSVQVIIDGVAVPDTFEITLTKYVIDAEPPQVSTTM